MVEIFRTSEDPSMRPFWVPASVDWGTLPSELRAAITALVHPAYQELVLGASDALERSTGLTIVHLLWLEVLQQLELGQDPLPGPSPESEDRQMAIDRHLRLVRGKLAATGLFHRLREFRAKWAQGGPLDPRFPTGPAAPFSSVSVAEPPGTENHASR